jgi:uncharacterized protein
MHLVDNAWLLSDEARSVLDAFGFDYTTTRMGIYHLPGWSYTRSPSPVYSVRSRWRRTMSLVLNRTQFIAFSQIPLLRLSLHPVDAMA